MIDIIEIDGQSMRILCVFYTVIESSLPNLIYLSSLICLIIGHKTAIEPHYIFNLRRKKEGSYMRFEVFVCVFV